MKSRSFFALYLILNFWSISAKAQKTIVEIKGNQFYINSKPTYEGRYWKGQKVEGLLMNARMVQGVFDDLNPQTVNTFAYPDTKRWDADRNNNEFIEAMPIWKNHGLNAFTLNMQGGSPTGYGNFDFYNPGFNPDGSLHEGYMKRLDKILKKADELEMVVILGLFYFGQDQRLTDETAIKNAVTNMVNWLHEKKYRHILIEINNETQGNKKHYDHDILLFNRVHELINLAKSIEKNGYRYYASTSFPAMIVPTKNVIDASDFILFHANALRTATAFSKHIEKIKAVVGNRIMPIVNNEDDNHDFEIDTCHFNIALKNYISWGYFDYRKKEDPDLKNGFQTIPVDWGISSANKKAFFNKVKEITGVASQTETRPMIWVKPTDKAAILDKITHNKWAKDYYEAFKARVESEVKSHQTDVKAYLSKMPFDASKQVNGQIPPFLYLRGTGGDSEQRKAMLHYLQTGIDCGVLYFLTDDPKYAQIGADILNTVVEGLVQLQPSEKGHNEGGLLYPDDHLREAREIGAQIPILYDFVAPFLSKGGLVYNVATDKQGTFSVENAEKVFKTYIKLALERGIIDCNWPVLESSSLVGNTLALHDPKERASFLEFYLTKNTPNQDALKKVANHYLDYQGFWPESLGYSSAVASLSTYLMTLLTKYDASLDLGNKYPQVPLALTTPYYLTYPNKNETVLFGDGHRGYHTDFDSFENAYYLGKISNNQKLATEFGALLNSGMYAKQYDRAHLDNRNFGAEVYREPLHLLWHTASIEGEVKDYPLPTTDELPFAGITLQRNLSTTGNAKDALMGFVGGGAHVHGHASGMSIELYGKGYVLGPKAGRGSYTTDLHENYFRLFAAHNTVIVNGASESAGGWVNLGTNRVEQVVLEPKVKEKPVSANYSFSTSKFMDNKGDKAEATQERTLGIVRTSPTTGYYIDVFRSKSALPIQFHDYIYRNLADDLTLESGDKVINFIQDSLRYKASATREWIKNRAFRHPGWHFFNNVKTAQLSDKGMVTATFLASKLEKIPIKMKLFINAADNREYTTALSPMSAEAPKPYSRKDNPTLVIRKKGEAWTTPFAVVYEPFEGTEKNGSVQSVESIVQNGEFKGLKIKSLINGKPLTQYTFILETNDSVFEDAKLGISFKGRYAVATLDEKDKMQSVYMGEGHYLGYKKTKITVKNGNAAAAFVDFSGAKPIVNTTNPIEITVK